MIQVIHPEQNQPLNENANVNGNANEMGNQEQQNDVEHWESIHCISDLKNEQTEQILQVYLNNRWLLCFLFFLESTSNIVLLSLIGEGEERQNSLLSQIYYFEFLSTLLSHLSRNWKKNILVLFASLLHMDFFFFFRKCDKEVTWIRKHSQNLRMNPDHIYRVSQNELVPFPYRRMIFSLTRIYVVLNLCLMPLYDEVGSMNVKFTQEMICYLVHFIATCFSVIACNYLYTRAFILKSKRISWVRMLVMLYEQNIQIVAGGFFTYYVYNEENQIGVLSFFLPIVSIISILEVRYQECGSPYKIGILETMFTGQRVAYVLELIHEDAGMVGLGLNLFNQVSQSGTICIHLAYAVRQYYTKDQYEGKITSVNVYLALVVEMILSSVMRAWLLRRLIKESCVESYCKSIGEIAGKEWHSFGSNLMYLKLRVKVALKNTDGDSSSFREVLNRSDQIQQILIKNSFRVLRFQDCVQIVVYNVKAELLYLTIENLVLQQRMVKFRMHCIRDGEMSKEEKNLLLRVLSLTTFENRMRLLNFRHSGLLQFYREEPIYNEIIKILDAFDLQIFTMVCSLFRTEVAPFVPLHPNALLYDLFADL